MIFERVIKLPLQPIATLAACLALAPTPAWATQPAGEPAEQPTKQDDAQARARAAYQRGTKLYNEGKFEEALAAFQEAATRYASPDFQFNIAKCYERLGDHEEAIRHYEIYLRTAEDPPDRAVVENSIADLERRIAEEAEQEEEEEEDAPEPKPEPEPEAPGRALIISGGVLLGVGAALGLGGGLGFGLQVSRDNATLGEVLDGNPGGLTFDDADAIADRARTNQTLEFVMVGLGGAVAITGVALLAAGMAKKNKSPGAAAKLRVAPSLARGGAGLIVQGSF